MTSTAPTSRDITSILDDIAAIAGELGDDTAIQVLEEVRGHKATSRLQLRVVGLPGSGRATLANLLIGAAVVPVSTIPKAPFGIDLTLGPAISVTRAAPDGDRVAVSPPQLRSLLLDHDRAAGRIEIEAPSRLLNLCDLHLEALETGGPADWWRSRLATSDYLILLLNATALLSEWERRFVRDSLVPYFGLERVTFLVNRMDLVPADERDSILDLLHTFLGPFESRPAIVDLSLRELARAGQKSEVLSTLMDDLLASREPARLEGLRQTAAALVDMLSASAERRRVVYALQASEVEAAREKISGQQRWLEQRVERTQRGIRAWVETLLRENFQRRIEGFAETLRNRLPDEIRSIENTALARRHLPGYIEAVWGDFLRSQVDTMRDALAAEEARVAGMIDADFRELLASIGQPGMDVGWDLGAEASPFHVFVMPRRAKGRTQNIARGLALNGFFLLFFSPVLGVLSLVAGQVVQRSHRAELAQAEAQALITSAVAAVGAVEAETKRRIDEQFVELSRRLEDEIAAIYRRGAEALLALLNERAAGADDLTTRTTEIDAIAHHSLPRLRERIGLSPNGETP